MLFYNNTILSETTAGSSANVHWRNNLILGENSSPANTNYSSSDYNGFRVNPGAPFSFQWNSPPWSTAADYTGLIRDGRGNTSLEMRQFATLAEYSVPPIRMSTASPWITASSCRFPSWMRRI